ncbi:glycosyltransferase [Luteibacter sp. PPL552]
MSRVLFCVVPERGHLNPCIGPALALRALGHDVAFHAPGDIREQLARAGDFACFGPVQSPRAPDARRGEAFARQVDDPAWLREWIRSLLIDGVPDEVGRIRATIAHWHPDVVVIDPLLYAAAIAAHLDALPWVSLSNSLNPVLPPSLASALLDTVRALSPQRDALFARYGMAPAFRGCDVLSPWLTTAFATAAFAPDAPGDVVLLGPSIPPSARGDETDFPWDRLAPDLPVVYFSLGSQIYYQPAMFGTVIEALRDRPVQLVMSVGDLLDTDALPSLGERMIAVRYAPQLAMLARASLFITHGGANSVMEGLAAGVPFLVSPLCNDQFHQVPFVERAGVGRAVDLRRSTPVDVAAVVDALLTCGATRANVARVAASYRRSGADEAARRISAIAEETHRAKAS